MGHSRAVAELALAACGPDTEAAALVHDLGLRSRVHTIWDKPGPLTRDERDRVETHPLVTDQLLRRVPALAERAAVAGAAHERVDGSGYHRRIGGGSLAAAQLRLLAVGLTTRQVAERLVISAKTADHHVQHIYTKIGVSTRGAAALFAIEHGIVTR